uniref:Uncharacterized protein n=1 Tax=Anguilla anguilla TaxID=7936 RepID=A0A0E9U3Y7_ANGAN
MLLLCKCHQIKAPANRLHNNTTISPL